MISELIFAMLCKFTLLVSYQPLCNMERGWSGGCHKLKYLALTVCSLAAAHIFISLDSPFTAIVVWLTIFLCLWPRILWWVRNDSLDFTRANLPRIYHAIAPHLLTLLEKMFGR